MHGRLRKLALGAVVAGGTLLFGIGLAGAQSSSSGGGGGGDRNAKPDVVHTSPSDVMIGAGSGSSGCSGDGGVTGAVVSSLDL